MKRPPRQVWLTFEDGWPIGTHTSLRAAKGFVARQRRRHRVSKLATFVEGPLGELVIAGPYVLAERVRQK